MESTPLALVLSCCKQETFLLLPTIPFTIFFLFFKAKTDPRTEVLFEKLMHFYSSDVTPQHSRDEHNIEVQQKRQHVTVQRL